MKAQQTASPLSPLAIIEPEGLNIMAQQEYEEVALVVDSDASETLFKKKTTLGHIVATESDAQKRGIRCEVANGEVIENEWGKDLRRCHRYWSSERREGTGL